MTKQKKPKTGDVVGWMVLCAETGGCINNYATRREARERAWREEYSSRKVRLAKIVLAK